MEYKRHIKVYAENEERASEWGRENQKVSDIYCLLVFEVIHA